MIKSVLSVYRSRGLRGVFSAIGRRIAQPRGRHFNLIASRLRGRAGLEIGGPSAMFRRTGLLPCYPIVGALDNCNFSNDTIWEGSIHSGRTFRFDSRRAPGRQFIGEAVKLPDVPSSSYDFVLSSHTLEHVANPIKAMNEWLRVLRDGGTLVLVLPERSGTFDHRRPVTSLNHLREDFDRDVGEDDLTHVAEVLALHDLARNPEAGSREEFEERCRRNATLRSIHHHVFDMALATELVANAGFRVLATETMRPYHVVIIAEKPSDADRGPRPTS